MTRSDIQIYTQHYGNQSSAGALRVDSIFKSLKDKYTVEIVTGMGVYPDGIKDADCLGKLYVKGTGHMGECIHKLYEYAAVNIGTFKRTLNYLSFMFSCFLFGLYSPRPRLIIVSSPPLFVAIGVYLVAVIRNIPYIIDIRDLRPESIKALGYISEHSLVYKALVWFEKHIYRRAKAVVTVTKGVKQGVLDKLPEQYHDKVHLLYNTSVKLDPSDYDNPYLNLSDVIAGRQIVLFAGNMNEAYDFDTVLSYIRETQDSYFVFIGDGTKQETLKIESQDIENLIVMDRKDFKEIKAYLAYCDAVVIPLQDTEFFKGTFPRKAIDALVNNKKIIYFGPEDGEFIEFYKSYDGDYGKFTYKRFRGEFGRVVRGIFGVGI